MRIFFGEDMLLNVIVCEEMVQDALLFEKVLMCFDVKASGITVSTKTFIRMSIIYLVLDLLLVTLVPRSNLLGGSVCAWRVSLEHDEVFMTLQCLRSG